jgi:excisionase family DNA binding protein
MPKSEQVLTTREVCRLLKIGRIKLYRLTRGGNLRCYPIGAFRDSPLRYRRSDLMEMLHRSRVMLAR